MLKLKTIFFLSVAISGIYYVFLKNKNDPSTHNPVYSDSSFSNSESIALETPKDSFSRTDIDEAKLISMSKSFVHPYCRQQIRQMIQENTSKKVLEVFDQHNPLPNEEWKQAMCWKYNMPFIENLLPDSAIELHKSAYNSNFNNPTEQHLWEEYVIRRTIKEKDEYSMRISFGCEKFPQYCP